MICPKCMPLAIRSMAQGLWAYISGKSLVPIQLAIMWISYRCQCHHCWTQISYLSLLIYSYTISFSVPTQLRAARWIVCHFRWFLFQYHKWLQRGGSQRWWGAIKWQVFPFLHTDNEYCQMVSSSLFELYISQIVANSMTKFTGQSCENF